MRDSLHLAFVWHMHQPYYMEPAGERYLLPWVRLHAIKDYYDMAALVEELPGVRVTFNLVPSLLIQLEDYAQGRARDESLELTAKPAAELTAEEKAQVLKTFFHANWETMIKPYPRYWELLNKRGRYVSDRELDLVQRRFSTQEMLDLQVWFNLAWFGEQPKKREKVLRDMIAQDRGFTEEGKKLLLGQQREYLARIMPLYRSLWEKGQVELTTSPFYHPILPLLCDLKIGQAALPEAEMPEEPLRSIRDAQAQTARALEYFEEKFGRRPGGFWPAEGSVSEEALGVCLKNDIGWTASDEQVLARTLGRTIGQGKPGRGLAPAELYRPYSIKKDGREIRIVFRDRFLSDLISFSYYSRPAQEAVADFVGQMRWIRSNLPKEGAGYLVTVILDGENAWEYYPQNGQEFLRSLYQALLDEPGLTLTTVGSYLAGHQEATELNNIWPGSWINADFGIWMGHEEDITGWDYLAKTRKVLAHISRQAGSSGKQEEQEKLRLAWEQIYIAEGSDWFWWFGDNFSSANDREFDWLFRENLMQVYRLLGLEVPEYLQIPIKELVGISRPTKEPVGLIKPVLDGLVTGYYEWLEAGSYSTTARGPMYNPGRFLRGFHYGFDLEKFYFRLDPLADITEGLADGLALEINLFNNQEFRIKVFYLPKKKSFGAELLRRDEAGQWEKIRDLEELAAKKIIELAVSFSDLSLEPGERIQVVVNVSSQGNIIEKLPPAGALPLFVPRIDYMAEVWHA